MASTEIKKGSIYVLLYVRNQPPILNDFHWGLYFHGNTNTRGMKYHIKTVGPGWMPDHGPVTAIMKEFLLVGLFRVADVRPEWHAHVDKTIRSLDDQLNVPGNTCRVWVLDILSLLQEPVGGYQILRCRDISALQKEIFDWGNGHAAAAAANEQPRPIGASMLCGL